MKQSHSKEIARQMGVLVAIQRLVDTMPNEGPAPFQISAIGKGEIVYQGPLDPKRTQIIANVYGKTDWHRDGRSSGPTVDYVKTLNNGLVIRIMFAEENRKDSTKINLEDFAK